MGVASPPRGGFAFFEEASSSVELHECYAGKRVEKYILVRAREIFRQGAGYGPRLGQSEAPYRALQGPETYKRLRAFMSGLVWAAHARARSGRALVAYRKLACRGLLSLLTTGPIGLSSRGHDRPWRARLRSWTVARSAVPVAGR